MSANEYELITRTVGVLRSAPRVLISLTGSDRLEWLQGQATNDVRHLAPEAPVSFCLCTPTGQIEAVVNAFWEEDRILLSTDLACASAVMRRIEQMVIMEDVEGEDLSSRYPCAIAIGPEARDLSADVALVLNGQSELWGQLPSSLPTISPEAWALWRLERGIPSWGHDISPKTLPPELGKDFESRHVSYTKGCFTGQEILHRIYSRGHTNKTWVGVLGEVVDEGSVVELEGRPVGVVSSAGVSPVLGPIGAATLRNEAVVDGLEVQVGGAKAAVKLMPFVRD